MEHATVPGATWSGRMGQHTRPQGCKRIRPSGGQAPKTFATVQVMIQAALAKLEGVVKGALKRIARLTSRQRYEQSTGRDPCRCPHGQGAASWTQICIYGESRRIMQYIVVRSPRC